MKVRCGTDMVDVNRIRNAIEKNGERFLKRVFTDGEITYCQNRKATKWLSFAARFAAKEAVSKALGTGFAKGVTPSDIEVVMHDNGEPEIVLYNEALRYYNKMRGESISVSMSHTDTHAIAMVVVSTG